VKIAFTTSGETLAGPLESRFGRAPKFIVYDLDSETFEVLDNEQSMNAAQGAGIQAAQAVAQSGVGGLVTGYCGPKAYRALYAAGIRIYRSDAPTVAEALEKYRSGSLPLAESSDVDGH
jgi:predicted Fe-Mo cluster-binding NifX family protein